MFAVYCLCLLHVIWAVYSIYVHRGIVHQQVTFSHWGEKTLRVAAWILIGHPGRPWRQHYAAIHRKHHQASDTEFDPHSPNKFSGWQLTEFDSRIWQNPEYKKLPGGEYAKLSKNVSDYDDQLEKFLTKYPWHGKLTIGALSCLLFGWLGVTLTVFHIAFYPHIHNWLATWLNHRVGYRASNQSANDQARNVFPVGILFAGEELHANHHNNHNGCNYKQRYYEFDLGYWYIRILHSLGVIDEIRT